MPSRYAQVKADTGPLTYLGVLPQDVAECLETAFAHIRKGSLQLWKLEPRRPNGPLFGKACGHLIFGSENPAGNTFVISALVRDDEDDFV
jgi:hypothetical protein